MKVYQVVFNNRVRFESIRLGETQGFATDLFNSAKLNPNKIIPDIYEMDREPVDHTRAR